MYYCRLAVCLLEHASEFLQAPASRQIRKVAGIGRSRRNACALRPITSVISEAAQ